MMSSDNSINTHIIGAPFIYLHELKKNNFFDSKGTIVFPSHSTPEIDVILSHKKLIEIVEKQERGPYTVCLYYTDYKKKNINIYKKKNGTLFVVVIEQIKIFFINSITILGIQTLLYAQN